MRTGLAERMIGAVYPEDILEEPVTRIWNDAGYMGSINF